MIRFTTVFHFVVTVIYIIGAIEDVAVISGPALPIPGNYFSKIVWLTIIDLAVGTLFWGLYLTNRDFIVPKGFADPMEVHPYFNHILVRNFLKVLHTLPVVAMFLDRVFWDHGRTKRKKAIIAMLAFIIIYIHSCDTRNFWVLAVWYIKHAIYDPQNVVSFIWWYGACHVVFRR
ncbi:unnamed protein product [Enterobius vermicularis]|uniref:OpgC protein n=1 Tax=Enterobius vermicularis TaxID=51028 RepID=A0A0N4VDQ3_ENTVE|nr:unnamed protein product [Enterobius vermicularis]